MPALRPLNSFFARSARISLLSVVLVAAACRTAPTTKPPTEDGLYPAVRETPRIFLKDISGFPSIASLGSLSNTPVQGTLWVVGPAILSVGAFVDMALDDGTKGGCNVLVDAGAFRLDDGASVTGLAPGTQLFKPEDREE